MKTMAPTSAFPSSAPYPQIPSAADAVPGYPLMSAPRLINVPIFIDTTGLAWSGGTRFSNSTYSLELAPFLSRDQFDAIVDELNECGAQHGPNLGRHKFCRHIPIVGGIIAAPVSRAMIADFRRALEATCARISRSSSHGHCRINLQVVKAAEQELMYVNLQVMM